MRIELAKRTLRKLTPTQLRRLELWIHDRLTYFDEKVELKISRRGIDKPTERQTSNKTYRLEGVRCGKAGCKCAKGELHGPYWYAYWSEGGKTKSEYVGKHLPESQSK
jgi:hypothetical protein